MGKVFLTTVATYPPAEDPRVKVPDKFGRERTWSSTMLHPCHTSLKRARWWALLAVREVPGSNPVTKNSALDMWVMGWRGIHHWNNPPSKGPLIEDFFKSPPQIGWAAWDIKVLQVHDPHIQGLKKEETEFLSPDLNPGPHRARRVIKLTSTMHIDDMLNRFSMQNCKPARTPVRASNH